MKRSQLPSWAQRDKPVRCITCKSRANDWTGPTIGPSGITYLCHCGKCGRKEIAGTTQLRVSSSLIKLAQSMVKGGEGE